MECDEMALTIIEKCNPDNNGRVPARLVLDVVAGYLSPESDDYRVVNEHLDPDSINPEIDANNLADALSKLVENCETRTNDVSLTGSNLLDSATPPEYQEDINELKSKLKAKEQTITELQKDLERNFQYFEETTSRLVAERNDLLNKLKIIKSSRESFESLTCDRDELIKQLQQKHIELASSQVEIGVLNRKNNDLEVEKMQLCDTVTSTSEDLRALHNKLIMRQETSRLECDELKNRLYSALKNVEMQEEIIFSLRFTKDNLQTEVALLKAEKSDQDFCPDSHFVNLSSESIYSKCVKEEDENDHISQGLSILEEFKLTGITYNEESRMSGLSFIERNEACTQIDDSDENIMLRRRHTQVDVGTQTEEIPNMTIIDYDYVNITHNNTEAKYIFKHLIKLNILNLELQKNIQKLFDLVSEYKIQINKYILLPMSDRKWFGEMKTQLLLMEDNTLKRGTFIEKILEEVQRGHSGTVTKNVDVQTDIEDFADMRIDNIHNPSNTTRSPIIRKTFINTSIFCSAICFGFFALFIYKMAFPTFGRNRSYQPIPLGWLDPSEIFSIFFQIEYQGEVPI